jgi:RAI1 like PD-(D/E)XK nuclease
MLTYAHWHCQCLIPSVSLLAGRIKLALTALNLACLICTPSYFTAAAQVRRNWIELGRVYPMCISLSIVFAAFPSLLSLLQLKSDIDRGFFYNGKLMKMWMPSYLAGVPRMLVGFRDNVGRYDSQYRLPRTLLTYRAYWLASATTSEGTIAVQTTSYLAGVPRMLVGFRDNVGRYDLQYRLPRTLLAYRACSSASATSSAGELCITAAAQLRQFSVSQEVSLTVNATELSRQHRHAGKLIITRRTCTPV